MPGIGWYTFNPNTRETEQEDCEDQASLGYRTRLIIKFEKKRGWGEGIQSICQ